jgi:hypothetical protein
MSKRKIAMVVNRFSLKEAEEVDDKYWSETTAAYRLKTLMELREMTCGRIKDRSIKKVVFKRGIYEEVENRE